MADNVNMIDRDACIEDQLEQVADAVENHETRLDAVETNGQAGAATEIKLQKGDISVSVRFMGQDEGQLKVAVGTTIKEVLAQLGGGYYDNVATAKLGDRVVPVTTQLNQDAVVEPTPQGGKVGC